MRAHLSLQLKTLLAAGTLLASGSVFAEGTTLTLSDLGLSEAQARALTQALNAPAASPGMSFGSPVGFGADWGEIGFAVGGQTLPEGNPNPHSLDGSVAATMGFGNAQKYVGLEVTANIISVRKTFGDDGALGAKIHTTLPGRSAFAVGVENVGRWGSAKGGKASVYAVGSKFFSLNPSNADNPRPLSVNIGVGDNAFNRVSLHCVAVNQCFDDVKDGASVFGGLAFYPIPQLSVIADWTGRSLNMGVSVTPFRSVGLVGTVGALNLTGAYQGRQFGDSTEFGAGIGYNYSF
jgi:hypothetical protein